MYVVLILPLTYKSYSSVQVFKCLLPLLNRPRIILTCNYPFQLPPIMHGPLLPRFHPKPNEQFNSLGFAKELSNQPCPHPRMDPLSSVWRRLDCIADKCLPHGHKHHGPLPCHISRLKCDTLLEGHFCGHLQENLLNTLEGIRCSLEVLLRSSLHQHSKKPSKDALLSNPPDKTPRASKTRSKVNQCSKNALAAWMSGDQLRELCAVLVAVVRNLASCQKEVFDPSYRIIVQIIGSLLAVQG